MPKQNNQTTVVPTEKIEQKILLLREKKVMLDKDLAELYGVETKHLKRQVRRNIERFPQEFMFELTRDEYLNFLRYHFGTLKQGEYSKYLPYAFAEPGVAMLSSVLNSKRAIQINIQIIKTFVRMREMIISNKELRRRLDELEQKYDKQFRIVFTALRKILEPPTEPKRQIGFNQEVQNLKPHQWIIYKLDDNRIRAAMIQNQGDLKYYKTRKDIKNYTMVSAFNRNEAWHKGQKTLEK